MSRAVKCPCCNEWFSREVDQHMEHKGRFFHLACYTLMAENQKQKDALCQYVQQLFGTKAPGPRVLAQIKKYITEYDYDYPGIMRALQYFYEVKNNTLEKSNGGIGIVPFIYVEAQNYYKRQVAQERKADALTQNSSAIDDAPTVTIQIATAPIKKNSGAVSKKPAIDITQL